LVLPSGIDGNYALSFALGQAQDITAASVIARAASTLGAINEELAAKWRRLVYLTKDTHAYYSMGVSGNSMTPKKVEGKSAEPVRSDTSGHMLPFDRMEDATAWTQEYLEDAHLAQIDSDISLIGARWINRVDKDIFTRMFTNTEESVGLGISVPWAIGSGVSVPFIPQMNGGYSFDTTHTHFVTQSGTWNAANAKLLLEQMVAQLTHHGLRSRFTAFVSEADLLIYAAVDGFTKFIPSDIQVVAGSTSAPIYISTRDLEGAPGEVFGFYLSSKGVVVELRYSERVPTTYAWMGKTFGDYNAQNPIAIRTHPKHGFGLRVDVKLEMGLQPKMDKALFLAGHGVGTNQRINGVAGMGNSASWVNPTIS
jgi:hypothetical protein